ncbi:hypothetical protein Tco_1269108, partial [Tanacetum coccineum]
KPVPVSEPVSEPEPVPEPMFKPEPEPVSKPEPVPEQVSKLELVPEPEPLTSNKDQPDSDHGSVSSTGSIYDEMHTVKRISLMKRKSRKHISSSKSKSKAKNESRNRQSKRVSCSQTRRTIVDFDKAKP